MAGIDDLEQPANKAEPLSPGAVELYLKAHSAKRPCAACGANDFEMWPEPDGATGIARGLVVLACRLCNATRSFLRPPVVRWVRENRSA